MAVKNPVVIPNLFAKATAKWQLAGRPHVYTVDWGILATGYTDANVLASDVSTAFKVPFSAANTINSYTYLGIDILLNHGGSILIGTKAENIVGTYAVNAAAPNVSFLVRKGSPYAGKQNRGRWYLPAAFVDEGGIDNSGVILAATVATLQARMTTWLAAEIAASRSPAILHRELIRDPNAPPPAMIPNPDAEFPTMITSLTWESLVATQRRRLRQRSAARRAAKQRGHAEHGSSALHDRLLAAKRKNGNQARLVSVAK